MSNKFSTYKIYAQLASNAYLDDKKQKSLNNYKFEGAIHNVLTGLDLAIYSNGNEKVIAFRGTDFALLSRPLNTIEDLLNDLFLGTQGNNLQGTYNLFGLYDELVKQGYVSNTDKIVVTGHSLGGYLAQLFTIANEDKISHTYTYNAPGLLGFKGTLLNLFGTSNIKSNKITDILAKDSINFTNAMGLNIGEEVKVSGNTHSIKDLTEILYFYDLAIKKGSNENEVTNYLSGFYKNTNAVMFSNADVIGIVNNSLNEFNKILNLSSTPSNSVINICNALEEENFSLNLITPNSSITSIFSGSSLSTSV